ncbi:MAG: LytR/AlgR family response regulator transcription factor [Bacteroidia bacterium]
MIQCLAVDDETLALDLLEDNIRQIPFLHLVKRCKNAYEAMEVLQNEPIDLIFLDIQMPGITGMQFLQSLQSRPMVIFITAYKKYALDGFNLDVLDYLVKPVPFDRFLKASNKALEYYNLKQKPMHLQDTTTEYIFVNSEYNLVKILINDITYIEGLKDYIKIHLTNLVKPVITRLSLKAIEEKLPSAKFIRVHKSFIISIDKISSIRKNRILVNESEVPLSDLYRANLFKIINPESI